MPFIIKIALGKGIGHKEIEDGSMIIKSDVEIKCHSKNANDSWHPDGVGKQHSHAFP